MRTLASRGIPDQFLVASRLEHLENFITEGDKAGPIFQSRSHLGAQALAQVGGRNEPCQVHAIGAPFLRRELLPDLLGRKAEHGSHGAHQGIQQAIKHRLRGSALPGFRRRSVEPIFDDIEIESAQINGGEIVERTVDLVKRELLIAFIDPLQDLRGPGQSPGRRVPPACFSPPCRWQGRNR